MSANLADGSTRIKAVDRVDYFDTIQIWQITRLTNADAALLRKHCGHLDVRRRGEIKRRNGEIVRTPEGEAIVYNHRDPRMIVRLTLHQPRIEALRWLAKNADRMTPIRIDAARDHVFGSTTDRNEAFRRLDRSIYKKYHRGGINRYDTTRYTNAKNAPINLTLYEDGYCRIDGQVDVVHQELRFKYSRTLKRLGISLADLPEFDFDKLWERHVTFRAADYERFANWILRRSGYAREQFTSKFYTWEMAHARIKYMFSTAQQVRRAGKNADRFLTSIPSPVLYSVAKRSPSPRIFLIRKPKPKTRVFLKQRAKVYA